MMTHRKFRRLVALLGLPEAHCRGLLELLWEVVYETGDPVVGDATDVEAAARWTGRAGDLVAALLAAGGEDQAGYIDRIEGKTPRFAIHDLHDHAPEYVKNRWRREQRRKEAGSRFRVLQSVSDPSVTDQQLVSDPSLRATRAPAPAPAPAPTQNYLGDDGFDRLWEACQKKVGKASAERAFDSLRKAGKLPPVGELVTKLTALQATEQWSRNERQYQPHLATWLNRAGWLDEVPVGGGPRGGGPSADPRRAAGATPESVAAYASVGLPAANLEDLERGA